MKLCVCCTVVVQLVVQHGSVQRCFNVSHLVAVTFHSEHQQVIHTHTLIWRFYSDVCSKSTKHQDPLYTARVQKQLHTCIKFLYFLCWLIFTQVQKLFFTFSIYFLASTRIRWIFPLERGGSSELYENIDILNLKCKVTTCDYMYFLDGYHICVFVCSQM